MFTTNIAPPCPDTELPLNVENETEELLQLVILMFSIPELLRNSEEVMETCEKPLRKMDEAQGRPQQALGKGLAVQTNGF